MAGYSGTPLVKKLGLKTGLRIYLKNAPNDYPELVGEMLAETIISKRLSKKLDVIHLFSESKQELQQLLPRYLRAIQSSGMIWVSWPKKSAKIATDITEDNIREIALPLGLVDIKVCAVDETWSALKLVIRKENR